MACLMTATVATRPALASGLSCESGSAADVRYVLRRGEMAFAEDDDAESALAAHHSFRADIE